MKNELIKNAELLLAKAEGLPEPHYDLSMKKSNWPDSMNTMLEEFVHSLCACGMEDELLEFAVWLELVKKDRLPNGLIQIISHCLYDNPNTPPASQISLLVDERRRGESTLF